MKSKWKKQMKKSAWVKIVKGGYAYKEKSVKSVVGYFMVFYSKALL